MIFSYLKIFAHIGNKRFPFFFPCLFCLITEPVRSTWKKNATWSFCSNGAIFNKGREQTAITFVLIVIGPQNTPDLPERQRAVAPFLIGHAHSRLSAPEIR